MQPLAIHLPSGHLIADRRFEWARGLQSDGDLAAAAEVLTQALELAPCYAAAWFMLGGIRETLGERDGAIVAFREALTSDPQDRHGAAVRLAKLGELPPVAMPEGYIRALFDGYAPAFDEVLTQGLGYRAPSLLLDAVKAARAPIKFGSVLDLGCGTGLSGEAFRPFSDWLIGVDLSPGMLAAARAKGIYDKLIEGEAMTFLRAEAAAKARYHLIAAADVFVYFHDLMQMPAAVARALAPGGLLAFSVETHDGEGVILRDTLRYAHSAAHVRAAVEQGGMTIVSLDSASTRNEKGVPVPGLVVVAGA